MAFYVNSELETFVEQIVKVILIKLRAEERISMHCHECINKDSMQWLAKKQLTSWGQG